MEKKNSDFKAKFPIALKMMLVLGLIVFVSLGTVTYLATYFDSGNTRRKGEDTNSSVNKSTAGAAENFFRQARSSALLFMDLINELDSGSDTKKQTESYFFERNNDFGAVTLISFDKDNISFSKKIINRKFLQRHELDENQINSFFENESSNFRKASNNEEFVVNATSYFGFASAAIAIPWSEDGKREALVAVISTESLSDSFCGVNHIPLIVNSKGDIIVHADFSAMQKNATIAKSAFFKKMNEYNDSARQFVFKNNDSAEYLISYQRLSTGGLCAITMIKASTLYEGTKSITKRNSLLALALMFLALLIIYLYSKTISVPIKELTKASEEIESGNFNVSVRAKSRDEIGALATSFNNMTKAISEGTGGMLFSSGTSGEIDGAVAVGEKKSVTVFFSGIRNFNAISQLLSPEETVGLLNEYMAKACECAARTKGSVEKFTGDSLMAVWGAPSSTGSFAMDALNSVVTALLMRSAIIELNKNLVSSKKPSLRIGCGINSGSVIAGMFGPQGRTGYAVIGEDVSLASQAEALNRQYGTDILITESTYKLISKLVTVEEMPSIAVHGRAEPVRIYAVINMPKAKNIPGAGAEGPKTLDEVRKLLGIPKPNLSKVSSDGEKKQKIG